MKREQQQLGRVPLGGAAVAPGTCRVRCGSATDLVHPANSVDYVFIDLPWASLFRSQRPPGVPGWASRFLRAGIFPHETGLRMIWRVRCASWRASAPGPVGDGELRDALHGADQRFAGRSSALAWRWAPGDPAGSALLRAAPNRSGLKANYLLTAEIGRGCRHQAVPGRGVRGRMIHALLNRTGPLSYDEIFQHLYPEIAQRRCIATFLA